MSFDSWLLYVITVLVASLVPGPSMLLALTHGTRFGAKRTLVTALGNTTASFLQATIAFVGLGVILTVSGKLFLVIKWLGAIYLVCVGVKMWRTSATRSEAQERLQCNPATNRSRMYWQAFFVAIGNPKAIVFFTALFPQFINTGDREVYQYIILVATLSVIAFTSFMIYALGGKQIGWLLRRPKAKKCFDRLIGGAFIGIGVNLALSES